MLLKQTVDTVVGRLLVAEQDSAITRLTWADAMENDQSPLLDEAVAQLNAYFGGELSTFDLPVSYACSAFQKRVCEEMCKIPYGSTVTEISSAACW